MLPTFSKQRLIIIGVVLAVILVFVLLFTGILPGRQAAPTGTGGTSVASLTIWGVDDESAFQGLIASYDKANPGSRITYQKFDGASYEKTLLDAMAAGRSPDIFEFHNTWLPKHYNKVIPVDPAQISLVSFQQLFPDVVQQDFTAGGKIYALPLYIDSLALFYNKDAFNAKAVANPPSTWQEFENLIPTFVLKNQYGQIQNAAAAIGGSNKSIDRASDLLGLLMLQFGSIVKNVNGDTVFSGSAIQPLNFYVQFADPSNPYYTWDNSLPNSINNFSGGSTAMIFDYASAISLIKNRSPFLNYGIAPMLQFDTTNPINYPSYLGLAVSNQSRNPAAAWNFIIKSTTDPQASSGYLQATGESPALRSLISQYLNNPQLNVFARQALTAKSWSQPDSTAVAQIFSDVIDSILSGKLNTQNALDQIKSQVDNLKNK